MQVFTKLHNQGRSPSVQTLITDDGLIGLPSLLIQEGVVPETGTFFWSSLQDMRKMK
ncbi:hypothetical protein [Allocoleopsis franciscana]|uniref:Uncharacterized protein n=1 Tax=Allocoleopsis franciscana PCC 7113 TaxID=1173027 RepID=K9WHK9_9CYAN|nr:hypothetical protein [Allocoleopsis franciscana]AFZ19663.1 hypothetical protein Mic7113_3956 [Allocoleopsis franciscana PCC 7113]